MKVIYDIISKFNSKKLYEKGIWNWDMTYRIKSRS